MLAIMAKAYGGLGEVALPYNIVLQVLEFYSFLMNCLCSWEHQTKLFFQKNISLKVLKLWGKHILGPKKIKDSDFHKCLIY